jgi:prepilin-type N-terminal cleavage/methylation domain-containing protein
LHGIVMTNPGLTPRANDGRRSAAWHSAGRSGFSLLEMLVVLAILSALTMVAVQSLGPVEQQARYETTKRTLEAIKGGLISVNQDGGTASVSGFIADTRLLPDLTSANGFYSNFVSPISGSAMFSFNGQSTIYQWQGPYAQANVTSTQFVDAWGRPLALEIQDASGTTIPAFTQLTDRLVISNISPTTTSQQFVSTTIAGNMLSAKQLSVNLYGLDLTGNRISLTGPNSPLVSLPQVTLDGGLVTTITGTVSAVGTDCTAQISPLTGTVPKFLVGNCILAVTTTLSDTTHYEAYSPVRQIMMLPGTSPVVDVLVVRQTSPITSGEVPPSTP